MIGIHSLFEFKITRAHRNRADDLVPAGVLEKVAVVVPLSGNSRLAHGRVRADETFTGFARRRVLVQILFLGRESFVEIRGDDAHVVCLLLSSHKKILDNSKMGSLQSIRQQPTPLNQLYFSPMNANVVHRGIREHFKNISGGIAIDYQSEEDVFTLMRTTFINNAGDHYKNIEEQTRFMNGVTIDAAVKQIKTGVMQRLEYLRTLDMGLQPIAAPVNTSTTGLKMDDANKQIGM